MGSNFSRLEMLFHEALSKPPQARAAYLNQECGPDAELRGSLERLLAAHADDASFMRVSDHDATLDTPLRERPGTVIGPYKLLEQIGEGGFGVVYMAEQERPIRRKVALKIIKPGMDTRQVIARFEAERQALALMDHPNIAKVFDAGETESGRPYFVMELVRGIPITAYCDQGKVPLRERLELFQHVCQAIQHAHHKGIMHRDIKPSNILVTLHDGVPVVKVIDFGIAKAMGHELTDKTMFTGFAQVMGTPLYASPEQVALSGLDIDTRTDVYSLGVLLYELLTGTTPFEKERLQKAAYEEMRRIVREEDPPRPSVRMTIASPETTDIAAQRASQPRRLAQIFRGELDWIVMKALEKDRSRRYDTPLAFAGDIARYLANDPVEARPPTAAYRVHKFVRRHTWGSGVAAAAVILLASSTILIWNEQRHTAMERDRAEAARKVAEAAAEQESRARKVAEEMRKAATAAEELASQQKTVADRLAVRATAAVEFLTGVLSSTDHNKTGANDVKVADLLDDAAKGVAEELQGQPELEIEIRYVLGTSYDSLRLTDNAREQWRAAYKLVPTLAPEDADYALVKVASALALAETQQDEGLRLLNEAQEATARIYEPTSREAHEVEARRGAFWIGHGKVADGKAIVQGLLDWADANPDEVTAGERITWLNSLAQAFDSEGDHAKARELRDLAKSLAEPPKGDEMAGVLNKVQEQMDHEKYAEARDLIEKSLPNIEARRSRMDPNVWNIIGQYETALLGTGEYQKRLQFMQDRADRLQSMQQARQIDLTAAEQAQLDGALADAYWLAGRDQEARKRYDQGLQAISTGVISRIGTRLISNINAGPISSINPGYANYNKGIVWSEAMLQEGLGRAGAWTTPALRAQVGSLLTSGFGQNKSSLDKDTRPSDLAMDAQWDTLRFQLRQWTAGQPHLKAIADGGLERLRSLRLPEGEYLLEVQFERANQPLTKLASWITILPFRAVLYPLTKVLKNGAPVDWYETKTTAPLAQRDFPSIAIASTLTRDAGPGGRIVNFALVGAATVRLPSGKYRIVVTRDDGVRVDLDGRRVIDSWSNGYAKEEESQEVALDAGNHALRVEFFQDTGPFQLWLRFEPTDPEATEALKPPQRTTGLENLTSSPNSILSGDPGNVAALLKRGSAYARYGKFELAAADFESARQIQPNDYPTLTDGAYAHLQAGQLTEYAARCQDLLRISGTITNLSVRERITNICTLGPSEIDGLRLKEIVDFDPDVRQSAGAAAWTHLAKGKLYYRNGDWKKAADELLQPTARVYDCDTYAAALFYLAMAQERLGDHDQARALWKKAADFADSEVGSEAGWVDLKASWGWESWIEVYQARQEAEVLLGLQPATRAATPPATAPRP